MNVMAYIDSLFKNRKIKPGQLLLFGFSERKNVYTYSTCLMDGQFEMTITVTKAGKVSTEVIDSFSKEAYVLHRIAGTQGAFVGTIRKEFEGVLAAIANDCFEPDVFKSENARQIIEYVRKKYQDELEF